MGSEWVVGVVCEWAGVCVLVLWVWQLHDALAPVWSLSGYPPRVSRGGRVAQSIVCGTVWASQVRVGQ